MVKNWKFCKNFANRKILSKIEIGIKDRNSTKKIKYYQKIFFFQKSKFCQKSKYESKIEIVQKWSIIR